MKKLLFALLFLTGTSFSIKAQNVDQSTVCPSALFGTWRLDMVQPGNVTLTSYFIIRPNNNLFEGTIVINSAVDLSFSNPRMEGDEAVFSTDWNRDYRLKITFSFLLKL
jgi:hypothetical protein